MNVAVSAMIEQFSNVNYTILRYFARLNYERNSATFVYLLEVLAQEPLVLVPLCSLEAHAGSF